jgi:hypothetical protein
MLKKRLIYALLIIFCIWLAFATRLNANGFLPVIAKYGGDIIWAGQFLFFLRILFPRTVLLKLAVCNYVLGVLVEVSQLYHATWIDNIRSTTVGAAMLGMGFLWSDLICYAVGTILAFFICLLVDNDSLINH